MTILRRRIRVLIAAAAASAALALGPLSAHAQPNPGSPGAQQQHGQDRELAYWKSVAESNDPDAFHAYIERFPDGLFVELARIRIAALKRARADADHRSQARLYSNDVFDGHWYSPEWKYSYRLVDGIGTATTSNSPTFRPGDIIIGIRADGPDTFSGEQIYRDGRWYKIKGHLRGDGQIYIQGEKNVRWTMTRID
jgi:hypothetical protein